MIFFIAITAISSCQNEHESVTIPPEISETSTLSNTIAETMITEVDDLTDDIKENITSETTTVPIVTLNVEKITLESTAEPEYEKEETIAELIEEDTLVEANEEKDTISDDNYEEKVSEKIYEKVTSVPVKSIKGTTNTKVNFRSEPSIDSDIIEVINRDKSLYILDSMKSTDNFYHAVVDGYIGYVDVSTVTIKSSKLYAIEDTKIKINDKEGIIKEGAYIKVYETADGRKVNSDNHYVVVPKSLVTYKEYIERKMDSEKFEKLTSFSTNYSLEKLYEGKAFNIDHCCKKYIDGMVVPQNETFNWFRDIGDTTDKQGFVLANIFSGGKTVKGYGGGVCQVSSTMYNCVINLGLNVIERHPHGKPVYYVDYYAGKDASVSDTNGGFNFVWKNTENYDIYIKAYTYVDESQPINKQGVLCIEFYKINI